MPDLVVFRAEDGRLQGLGEKGYSQLIDRVSAFAATELGVTFPATFQQWEGMQVDPDTGEIL